MIKRSLGIIFFLSAVILLTGAGCFQFGTPAAGPMGVFRSADKGENWQAVMAYPTVKGVQSISTIKVFRLFEDPSDVNAMYLATRSQGLFYTYNNGDSWQYVSALAGKFIYALAVDPQDKCTIYVSDGPHIFKTTDCSRTWSIVYTEERPDQRVASISIDREKNQSIYAAILGGDIIKSQDRGRSWRVIKRFNFNLQQIAVDPNDAKRIYMASHRSGFYRSDDGGESWNSLNKGLEAFNESKNFYRLILNSGQAESLFWISKYGILRSDDKGDNWKAVDLITPPGSVNIYGFAINPKNQNEMYYTGTILGDRNVHVRSTFYKSTDGGKNWVTKKMPSTAIPSIIRIHPENPSILFMGFTTLEPSVQISF